jgi:hypothetical protein
MTLPLVHSLTFPLQKRLPLAIVLSCVEPIAVKETP